MTPSFTATYLPSELWHTHVLSELSSEEVLDSICGIDRQLAQVGTSHMTATINNQTPLSDLFSQEKKLDRLFKYIQNYPASIKYLDFSDLNERPLYFIPASPSNQHLICHDPIEKEELNRIEAYAEWRKLKNLKHLDLSFLATDPKYDNFLILDVIYQLSQITSLSLKYIGKSNDYFPLNHLESLPYNLVKLVLHNADLTAEKVEIFRSEKFKELTYLDLSFHDCLRSSVLVTLLEGNMPKLEILILDEVGAEAYPHPTVLQQIIPLSLKKISLNNTFLRNTNLFIDKFTKLKQLEILNLSFKSRRNVDQLALKDLQKTNPTLKITTILSIE